MSVVDQIKLAASKAISEVFSVDVPPAGILVNTTNPEFEGDYTVVLFALIKQLKRSPDEIGNALGQ